MLHGAPPFAILLNTTVQNCTVANNTKNTIIEAFTPTATSGTGNSSVTDGGGNSLFTYKETIPQPVAPAYAAITTADLINTYGIDFDRTYIMAAETIRSDLIKLTFNRPVLNANDEIDTQVTKDNIITIGGTDMNFTARLDGDTAPVLSINANDLTQDTTTYYALKEFYIHIPNTHTFRTDATGSAAANAANGGLGGSNSTNTQGNKGNSTAIVPDISFAKGIFFGSNGADLVTAMSSGGNTFNTTSDGIPPLLLEILVGRNGDTSDARSYHNYFKLRYSEPVAFGDADGAVIGDSSTEDAVQDLQYAAGTTFVNAVSTTPFDPGPPGMPNRSGGEIITDMGTVTVPEFFHTRTKRIRKIPCIT